MKIKMTAKSDVGVARSVNEDFCGIFEENKLAIVCDGMGGHKAGAQASRLTVTTIRYMYMFLDAESHYQVTKDLVDKNLHMCSRLISSVRLANRNIYTKSIQDATLRGMGTTVSALAIQNDAAFIAHVGDSRIYRIHENRIELLTEDHTWLNELIQDKEIDIKDIDKFEKKNVITRALGLSSSVKIDLQIVPIKSNDIFLICTDGLTKAVTDDEIFQIVTSHGNDHNEILDQLIDTAKLKDGSDNITAAIIAIGDNQHFKCPYQPLKLTLNDINEQDIRLETRILKRELNEKNLNDKALGRMSKILKNKKQRVAALTMLLSLIILLAVYAFSKHKGIDTENAASFDDFELESSYNKSSKIISTSIENNSKKKSSPNKNNAIPDSIMNKMIVSTFQNQSGKRGTIDTREFMRNNGGRGMIYLAGIEKIENVDKTSLFVNGDFKGKTTDYWNTGLQLLPGYYNISIRDTSGQIIHQRGRIRVTKGNIKTIEFN